MTDHIERVDLLVFCYQVVNGGTFPDLGTDFLFPVLLSSND